MGQAFHLQFDNGLIAEEAAQVGSEGTFDRSDFLKRISNSLW